MGIGRLLQPQTVQWTYLRFHKERGEIELMTHIECIVDCMVIGMTINFA